MNKTSDTEREETCEMCDRTIRYTLIETNFVHHDTYPDMSKWLVTIIEPAGAVIGLSILNIDTGYESGDEDIELADGVAFCSVDCFHKRIDAIDAEEKRKQDEKRAMLSLSFQVQNRSNKLMAEAMRCLHEKYGTDIDKAIAEGRLKL